MKFAKIDRINFARSYRQADSGCWEWTGALHSTGYGYFYACITDGNGASLRAHRAAWELEHGPIPADMCVLHRCDNRKCVNPGHLFLGTHKQNSTDMVAKGRQFRKLTDTEKAEIRRLREGLNGLTYQALAEKFGVAHSTAYKTVNGYKR